jgi:hypothetical protein
VSVLVAPIVAGTEDDADAFDYACSRARAEAIDAILIEFLDGRGWALDDQHVIDHVTVEHDGDTRARILYRGEPVTPWWQDRVERSATAITWTFEAVR